MSKKLTIAIAGNPNSGKTTIFNALTGARQHVGNYPGVTVDKKEGDLKCGPHILNLVDLPGTYALSARSLEEKIARDFIIHEHPELVIHVIDASNFERNMYLALQIMQLGVKMILVLNMSDMAAAQGFKINLKMLEERLNVWVVETVGHKKAGMEELKRTICQAIEGERKPVEVTYGHDIENAIGELLKLLGTEETPLKDYSPRWLALKLLEEDPEVIAHIRQHHPQGEKLIEEAYLHNRILTKHLGDTPETYATEKRYGFISGLHREIAIPSPVTRKMHSDQVDTILTHRLLGLPIFLGLMYVTFQLTFTLGEIPMTGIEQFFSWLGTTVAALWPPGTEDPLKSLLIDGVIGGVGGVIVFLPNIVLLFLAIAILEDTGYMARAAFLIDRLMHKIGLHGKSFIPMLIGFGCSIPAIMATRTLENRKDRLTTMLVIPLMSCGARLPIYTLIIPAFFPAQYRGQMLFLMYFIGIVLAIGLAKLLRSTLFAGENTPFVMELPPYRLPTFGGLLIHMWEKAWLYLKKAGTIILMISILMWALTAYPKKPVEEITASTPEAIAAEELEYSIAGRMGGALTPILEPLGFDWKLATGFIGAFAAKEVFVSQMGIVYALGEADEESASLRELLARHYTPLVGFCVMLFMLIATPCMSTVVITKRESGSWKWACLQFFGLTVIAYGLTFLVYQGGRMVGL